MILGGNVQTLIREKAWQLAKSRHISKPTPKCLLSVNDFSNQQIRETIRLALQMKESPQEFRHCLQGRKIALLFQKTSTRTRCSFETGISEMGGFSSCISWQSSNIIRADLAHETRVLSHYYDAIMARVNQHHSLEIMAKSSLVPVISGMSDIEHPCQAISDCMTLSEYFGPNLSGLHLLYIGDAANNVCRSLALAAAALEIEFAVAAPADYRPDSEQVKVLPDINDAAKWADVIYTDAWVSIGYEEESEKRKNDLQDYQVNRQLLQQCHPQVLVMHCLPAHVGDEITADILESPRSIVFDQAENRCHSQKAILNLLLSR